MKIEYTVVGASSAIIEVQAMVAGETMLVGASGVVIEMTSSDGTMGHSFKFITADPDAVIAEFAPGRSVEMTLTAK